MSSIGSYTYDDNGNRQTDPTYSYIYDVENHLTTVTQGANTVPQNTFDGDGNRLIRVANGQTSHYLGEWYEFNLTTGIATVYYPFNGQAIAMKQGSTLYYLHRDPVGSVVSVSDASGNEVASARYWPFGGARLTTDTLPTDRLFTGQIRDLGDDRFYFFKARYYDATIGKFVQPDTIVPDAKNPQALNRYAYGLNNPMKFVDPSGHDAMDLNWKGQFTLQHGYGPSEQDWQDRQFSQAHPGSGLNGARTDRDWNAYTTVRNTLGPALLAEIGRPQDVGIAGKVSTWSLFQSATKGGVSGVISGPDGTTIYLGGQTPTSDAEAWTLGNDIILAKSAFTNNHLDLAGVKTFADLAANPGMRALIAHEYTHVLQYRLLGPAFLPAYVAAGANAVAHGAKFGSDANVFERPAYNIGYVYQYQGPTLPAPWEFPAAPYEFPQ